MDSHCRLCGELSLELLPILEDLELPNKIFELYHIKVNLEDQLPTVVCHKCWDMVHSAWLNYLRVQKAQEHLNELLESLVNVDPICQEEDNVDFSTETSKLIDCVITNDPLPLVKNENQIQAEKNIKPAKVRTRRSSQKKKDSVEPEELSELSIIEFKEDGSCVPKEDLFEWSSYPWICCDCQQTFRSSEELKNHFSADHNQVPKYSCADCQKIYTKYIVFLNHVKLHHVTLRYCCDVCHKWYPTVNAVEKHRVEHKDETQYVCLSCGKTFRMQSALALHSRSHLPAEIKNKYQCDECPKRFGTKPNLMAHKRIHSGVKDYTCDQCGKSFFQKGNLDNHVLTHTAARPFHCNTCNKSFKTLVRLKKHSSVHSGLKPHKCDICGRQFRERGTLKEHHRIHTGAMPFTCEFCGKNFRFKGVLTTHRRQHTGERPYSCHECQHHFTNWPNYNKHMKRRHGINTSVTVRKPQSIPPTGMPNRNPPGTVLAQPISIPESQETTFVEQHQTTFFPVLGLYNIAEDLLQQQRV
ncbi:gastrula zinc finger protein XlCGF26.1-like [Coccinella septempunctata]|uniref:gastrula zinc finger protein XlCGF26.1-like n=1 Tax=Coccinella septempunctata TaxID=41139 RepID=UPI001D06DAA9|nr:gastrula zinc finger protein XlCGF26.1-like [Coccinella septempunctata]